jgi:hypothetical protein
MIEWIKENRTALVRNSFLLPILLVVIMSISHVVSWYDLGNPISWAIYLSVAIEIFALASISAASINASKTTIWILFGIVTAIQVIGNVFYEFNTIDDSSSSFKSWVSLIDPLFIDWTVLDHRRFLSIIQGGTLPILSLTALHFYIQFKSKSTDLNDSDLEPDESILNLSEEDVNVVIDALNDQMDYEDLENDPTLNKDIESPNDVFPDENHKVSENSPINEKNKIVESGSGLPGKSVKSNKGNNATIEAARKEINTKTGKFN